tara:strand:- start:1849 stop:1992 length:144 start_codon:yes stop_codon:yes gene_type:complete
MVAIADCQDVLLQGIPESLDLVNQLPVLLAVLRDRLVCFDCDAAQAT